MSQSSSLAQLGRASAMFDGRRPRILVVDDSEDNRELVSLCLAALGAEIATAASGEAALAAIAECPPDLILLDVMMPGGMSGFEACRKLKTNVGTMFIPVVLVTALDGKDDRVRGIEAGADDFLSKPINREELLARSRSLLRLQQTRRELEAERLAAEVRRREHVRDTFKRYVAPTLVDQILSDLGSSDFTAQSQRTRRDAVILFADIRGFTRMAETLEPIVVVALLNEYFSLLTAIAFRHQGTIFGMAGDSLLVGFGVPFAQPDAARRAVASAVEMQREFGLVAADWRVRYGIDVSIGIGINSGDVIAGNVGSPTYMNFAIVGDPVNTASRLTALAGRGETLVSEGVVQRFDAAALGLAAEALPPVALKGKVKPVTVFRLKPLLASGSA